MKRIIIFFTILLGFCFSLFAQTGGIILASYYDTVYMKSLNGGKVQLPESFLEEMNHFNIISYEQAFPYSKKPFLKSTIIFYCNDHLTEFASYLQNYTTNLFSNVVHFSSYPLNLEYDPTDYFWNKKKTGHPEFPDSVYYLWHLKKIEADRAWDITKGDPNIKIAVIDHGFNTWHPDLFGKVNHGDPLEGLLLNNIDTDSEHGLAMACLAAGITDGGGRTASVGFNSGLVLYACSHTYNNMLSVITVVKKAHHAVLERGASVINFSAAGISYTPFYDTYILPLIDEIHDNGAIIVRSAGSVSSDSTTRYPFALSVDSSIIIVGNSDYYDKRADSAYNVAHY